MPTEHPTREELDERIQGVISRMRKGDTIGQIRQWLKKEYGVKTRTCDRYLSRARREILNANNRTEDDLRIESMAFYEGVRADTGNGMFYRLKAQERLDILMGLERPKKVAMTDPSGTSSATIRIEAEKLQHLPPDQLAKLAEAHDLLKNAGQNPANGAG